MLLTVDIGNTFISLGLFEKDVLKKKLSVFSGQKSFRTFLRAIFSAYKIEDVIISSVVPSALSCFLRDLKKFKTNKPVILGKYFRVPIINKYRHPKQVGQDRLVNAYAAWKLFGAPLVVVDFGTAITFDVISKKNEYLGGMILPGLRISLNALFEKTALLPKVKLIRPQELIGRDTKNSMLSGIVYGYARLTDSLVLELKRKLGKNALAIGTGGDIKLISSFTRCLDYIDQDLILKGLNLIAKSRFQG